MAARAARPLACCLPDPDRQALTDLVSSLAFRPVRMAVDQRRAVVGDEHARSVCTVCGRPRMMCVGGCDLVPTTVWRVPAA